MAGYRLNKRHLNVDDLNTLTVRSSIEPLCGRDRTNAFVVNLRLAPNSSRKDSVLFIHHMQILTREILPFSKVITSQAITFQKSMPYNLNCPLASVQQETEPN